jgi:hypothetical protein
MGDTLRHHHTKSQAAVHPHACGELLHRRQPGIVSIHAPRVEGDISRPETNCRAVDYSERYDIIIDNPAGDSISGPTPTRKGGSSLLKAEGLIQ